mgnify:CR=1 FL=1
MSGIVNSTGAVSGIIGTTVGTPAAVSSYNIRYLLLGGGAGGGSNYTGGGGGAGSYHSHIATQWHDNDFNEDANGEPLPHGIFNGSGSGGSGVVVIRYVDESV